MAAAAPAGNFMIALVAFVLIKIGLSVGWFVAPDTVTFSRIVTMASGDADLAGTMLSMLVIFNVIAGTFNLLPLPPLDGSAVLSIFLPPRLAEGMRSLERNAAFSMVGLIVAWRVLPLMIDPLFSIVLQLVHPDASYR